MKLLFQQRFFSWFDSYDIYNEAGQTLYTVKGQLSWGHCLKIFDSCGNEVGIVKERLLTFLPKFELYLAAISAASARNFPSLSQSTMSIATADMWKAISLSGITASSAQPGRKWPPYPSSFSAGRIPM